MFIDTHTHLDFVASATPIESLRATLESARVFTGVICAVEPANFEAVKATAQSLNWHYALGIHPMYTEPLSEADLRFTLEAIAASAQDPRCVAAGEMGLDYYIANPDKTKQKHFLEAQLEVARDVGLPVTLHARRALFDVIASIKKFKGLTGVIHAFPGSVEEARQVLDLGFKLGVGGAVTYPRSMRLHRVVKAVPLEGLVLETDAPDMAPVWSENNRSTPQDLGRYAECVAQIRGEPLGAVIECLKKNALSVFPRTSHPV